MDCVSRPRCPIIDPSSSVIESPMSFNASTSTIKSSGCNVNAQYKKRSMKALKEMDSHHSRREKINCDKSHKKSNSLWSVDIVLGNTHVDCNTSNKMKHITLSKFATTAGVAAIVCHNKRHASQVKLSRIVKIPRALRNKEESLNFLEMEACLTAFQQQALVKQWTRKSVSNISVWFYRKQTLEAVSGSNKKLDEYTKRAKQKMSGYQIHRPLITFRHSDYQSRDGDRTQRAISKLRRRACRLAVSSLGQSAEKDALIKPEKLPKIWAPKKICDIPSPLYVYTRAFLDEETAKGDAGYSHLLVGVSFGPGHPRNLSERISLNKTTSKWFQVRQNVEGPDVVLKCARLSAEVALEYLEWMGIRDWAVEICSDSLTKNRLRKSKKSSCPEWKRINELRLSCNLQLSMSAVDRETPPMLDATKLADRARNGNSVDGDMMELKARSENSVDGDRLEFKALVKSEPDSTARMECKASVKSEPDSTARMECKASVKSEPDSTAEFKTEPESFGNPFGVGQAKFKPSLICKRENDMEGASVTFSQEKPSQHIIFKQECDD